MSEWLQANPPGKVNRAMGCIQNYLRRNGKIPFNCDRCITDNPEPICMRTGCQLAHGMTGRPICPLNVVEVTGQLIRVSFHQGPGGMEKVAFHHPRGIVQIAWLGVQWGDGASSRDRPAHRASVR